MTKYRSVFRTFLLLALVTCTGFRDAAAAIPPAYTVTDLGTLGGTHSKGYGINASGQVTGESFTIGDPRFHAFLWTPTTPNGASGTMLDLGTLGGSESYGRGINSSGQVTGYARTPGDAETHAFLYDGTMHDLGTLSGSSSEAFGINASGQVTGYSGTTGDAETHAFLWTPTTPNGVSGAMQDLGTLGGNFSHGFGINASGHVTGGASTSENDETHAFLYDGMMHDLGTFAGGLGINASGQVTGSSVHAFLWTPTTPNGVSGAMKDLGTLGGFYSYGFGINASGHVTGYSSTGNGASHAFLYTSDSGMVDLNSLIDPLSGWELIEARGINDVGQITGIGFNGREHHAFLLTPVPEPSSLALLALGLPFLVWRNSRRSGIGGTRDAHGPTTVLLKL